MLDESEVRARLEQEAIPNVDHFEIAVGHDHTGAECAFIYVIVPDTIAELDDFSPYTQPIDDRIFALFKRDFPGFWPHVNFRSVSEAAAL